MFQITTQISSTKIIIVVSCSNRRIKNIFKKEAMIEKRYF